MESPNSKLEVSKEQFPAYLLKIMASSYDETEKFWGFDGNKLVNYKQAQIKVILKVRTDLTLEYFQVDNDKFQVCKSRINISVEKEGVKSNVFEAQLLAYRMDYKHIEQKQAWAISFSYAKKYASKYQNYFVAPSVWFGRRVIILVFLIEKSKLISLSQEIWNFIVESSKEVEVKLDNLLIDESMSIDMNEQNEQSEPEPTDRADILKQKLSSQ